MIIPIPLDFTLEMLHANIPSNSHSQQDSTGFSSETSSAMMNTDDCYKTKYRKHSDSDYYSGYSAWTRGGRPGEEVGKRYQGEGEGRCGRG
jgi:hypothetical protein